MLIFFVCFGPPRNLHSFPTRRSSDLDAVFILPPWKSIYRQDNERYETYEQAVEIYTHLRKTYRERSEEHTSELQSRGHLVCRLLLEKKNNQVAANGY